MTVSLHLRQQSIVLPSSYLVVDEIQSITGLVGPLADNLVKIFLIHRFDDFETFTRVCTLNDYITYQPYPDPSADLINFKSAAFLGVAQVGWKVNFPDLPPEWDTLQGGAAEYDIDDVDDDVVHFTARLPSTLPNGEAPIYELLDSLDVVQLSSTGIPTRTVDTPDFRDSVIYSYFSTANEANAHMVSVRTNLQSVIKQMNTVTDEDFNVVFEDDIDGV